MILTEEQRKEFETVTRPLMEWLCKNCHPHVVATVEPTRAELTEGLCSFPCTDYVQD
jgi:hypothetical protein